jgi:hypothetical protein
MTPEWVTSALRASGTLRAASVNGLSIEEIGAVQGFLGRVVRVRLRYDLVEPGAPASLVAKFPNADPEIRAHFSGAYVHEHRFYTRLAASCPVPTPALYAAVEDGASGATVLLLQDLGHLRGGDDVAGCSDAEAFLVVEHMARLHADWWDSPRLDEADLYAYAEHADGAREAYHEDLPRYLEKVGGIAPPPVLELVTRYADYVATVRRRLGSRPCTFVHGDFRLDNLFFGTGTEQVPLTVGDWQGGTLARGIVDLGWFAGTGLGTAQRRAIEWELVDSYHRALVTRGVSGYDLAQCRDEYRLSLLNDLVIFVMAVAGLDFGTDRAHEIVRTSFDRWPDLIADHGLLELLATL